jgi:hypothetical protein
MIKEFVQTLGYIVLSFGALIIGYIVLTMVLFWLVHSHTNWLPEWFPKFG